MEVGANGLARLFDQDGQLLFEGENPHLDQGKSTSAAKVRTVSSVLTTPSITKPNEFTKDWMVQKMLAEKAGPQTPLLLKLQSANRNIIDNHSLVNAVSEALWDFPSGTWSSKNLSCITLAKKANRHAMRVVRVRDGKPYLPKINPGLKDSLFFV